MTIQIQEPELEALILERMRSGAFPSIEQTLLQALKSSPLSSAFGSHGPSGAPGENGPPELTGADLVAAMQSSPHKEIALEPTRHRFPVRDIAF